MVAPQEIPFAYRILAFMQERNRLFAYPMEQLADEIKSDGFRCDCCGKCCTRAVNQHIFLLDHDVAEVRTIDPAAYEPAPDPEFCDQNGVLYVSGYALRMKEDDRGSCWFLRNGKCGIYNRRFSGCRIYPHMLRRNADLTGQVTWLRFARYNMHGGYLYEIPDDECLTLAREIKEYENAFLSQQISFLETLHDYFTLRNLRHDPDMRERQLRNFSREEEIRVMVYHDGELHEHRYEKPDIIC